MDIVGDLFGHGVDNRDKVLGERRARAGRFRMLGRRWEGKGTVDAHGVALVEGR